MTISRRTLLSLLPAAAFGQSHGRVTTFPPEAKRYSDPVTEFSVVRLTDPGHASILPSAPCSRALSRRSGFLLCSSNRTGRWEAVRLDTKTGQSRQTTEAEQLVPATVQLLPDERNFAYFDGPRLEIASFGGSKPREVYRCEEGFAPQVMALAEDALYAAVVEKGKAQYRLRLVPLGKGDAITLAESEEPLSDPQPRPRRASVLYRRGDSGLFVANYDLKQTQRLKLIEGAKVMSPQWSLEGREILYISASNLNGRPVYQMREIAPDTNKDAAVARTTQFAVFGRNGDGSVFVGASGSKAQPHVLLLVRSVKRELTLCEHRASDPAQVSPIFSPNSQRIFFQSDQHGKWAIYSMVVEKLVEETEA